MDFTIRVRSNDGVQSSRRGSTNGFHNQGEEQRSSPELTPREHISDTVSALQASKMLSAARGMLVVIHGASSTLVRGVFAPIVALCAISSHRLPGPACGRESVARVAG